MDALPTLKHLKGLSDLAVLLGRPGREVHVLDLSTGGGTPGTPAPRSGDLGEVLDPQAREAYRTRLRGARRRLGRRRGGR